jgi:hypothetical protein
MRQIKKIVYSIIFFLFIASSAISQEKNTKSDAGGPASAKELIGFWKMIPLPNKTANKVNPWPQDYQWFWFTDKGKVYSMMNSEYKEYSSSELRTVFKVLSKDKTPNYKLQGQFVTIDNPTIKNYKELWGTNIFAKDIEGIANKGDMIMTLDDGTQTGKVVYYRLLRRIK